MSSTLSKSLGLSSSLKMDQVADAEAAKFNGKQGIVFILGSDCERSKVASLRRTLSADMSSKNWLEKNGFSPAMKKIASVEEFPVSVDSTSSSSLSSSEEEGEEEDDGRPGEFEIWSSIREEQTKKKKKEMIDEKPGQFDIWSSILSQKAQEDASKFAPYIHPLVKRSASSLSKKSLEICTESLGSETGSDGFSSYPPSETGDWEDDKEEEQQQNQKEFEKQEKVSTPIFDKEESRIAKYSCSYRKKSPPRSFPPPLPSLSRGGDAFVRMQTHRNNGRLVVEAVSVPSQNCFRAQRQDGRLLLTFVNNSINEHEPKEQETVDEDHEEEREEFFDEEFEKEEEEEEEEIENVEEKENIIGKEMGIVMEHQQAPRLTSEVINVHTAAVMMNKLVRLANYRNPTWPKKLNVVKFEEEEEEEEEELDDPTPLPQSYPQSPRVVARLIPPPPAAAAATTFNAYEYCWRRKPTAATKAAVFTRLAQKPPPLKSHSNSMLIFSKSNPKENEQQQLVLLRGNKADYLVPLFRGCKEPRRSLLFWEPYCIATS